MKLACVVHRFGADIAGGSEGHCRLIAEHLDALGERGNASIELVRRPRRRHEPDLVERGLFVALLRHGEVAEMHRIEGAAEDADAHKSHPKETTLPVVFRSR